MPELPEVESFRLRFDRQILNRKISDVKVLDDKVLRGYPAAALHSFLTGASFSSTTRRGKYFLAHRSTGKWLHIHLGMTGDMILFDPSDECPRFTRIILHFETGNAMAYADMRKFGRFYPVADLERFLREHRLGPDGLAITQQQWLEALHQRKGILKAVLLDQSVVAGLGNLYIDEICLQTGIHPGSRVEYIPEQQLIQMHQVMVKLFHDAIDRQADTATYPTKSLWAWREAGYHFPDGRGPVETMTLAGRTTCVLPDQIRY
ncbi:MAG: hypothetical protein H6568_09235 [Lewinellaceae bacterium]|nr:hypothetical protein [Saprospiraceae bacterium]MCB9312939.1 hypothetical protein [Lewinellaceae bacterium]HRW74380.1 DNA-formamidopyrimidine glycosylase family protein [Saprospiraceae bacterium]